MARETGDLGFVVAASDGMNTASQSFVWTIADPAPLQVQPPPPPAAAVTPELLADVLEQVPDQWLEPASGHSDPASIRLCHDLNLDYVSCSPYRIPVARLAAAHAALRASAHAASA